MSTIVFGVRIFCGDHAAPVTPDATIGLYAVTSLLQSNAAAAQKDVILPTGHGTYFEAGEVVQIHDTSGTEENIIASIANDTLTMQNDLANAYATTKTATVDADSQLRWQQNAVAGLMWGASDMLIKNGIGKLSRAADLSYGGNTAFPGGFEFNVKNTGQLWKTLEALGIFLTGKKAEPVYFVNTTMNVLRGGVCQQPQWTAAYYSVQVSGDALKRNATITQENAVEGTEDQKVVVPATFGLWKDSKAKLARTVASEVVLDTQELAAYLNVLGYSGGTVRIADPDRASTFPVLYAGTSPTLAYTMQVGLSGDWPGGIPSVAPTDLYIKITTHNPTTGQDCTGFYRKVSAFQNSTANSFLLGVVLQDYLPNDLAASLTAVGSWVSFVRIDKQYCLDTKLCAGFLDSEGSVLKNGVNLFSYESQKQVSVPATVPAVVRLHETALDFYALPSYVYDLISGSTDNNKVTIRPLYCDSNTDTVNGFLIFPMNLGRTVVADQIYHYYATTLAAYGYPTAIPYGIGAFADPAETNMMNMGSSQVNRENLYDKDISTQGQFLLTHPNAGVRIIKYRHVIEFLLPSFPSSLPDFDKVYVGIKFGGLVGTFTHMSECSFYLRKRKFLGVGTDVLSTAIGDLYWDFDDLGGASADCLPDFYFETDPATGNKNFYVESKVSGGKYLSITGYQRFDLGISNADEYRDIYACALIFMRGGSAQDFSDAIKIYELAIVFEKNVSIGDLYTTCAGRKFNDTFGGRKSSLLRIESPGDLLEAICRMQNWSEYGLPPTGGWGADYASQAKIKKSGTGSFDSTLMQDVNYLYKGANQILSTSDGDTDKIKKTICQDFLLCNYVDNTGSECVVPISKNQTTPTNTVTLADIKYAHSEIKISEPDPMKVFPELVVRYNKNMGSGGYDSLIRIKNVTDNPANVTTATIANYFEDTDDCFNGAEAVVEWNVAHDLWLQTGYLTEVPESVSDLQWANGTLANAKAIAKNYFVEMLRWMGLKTVSFAVHFTHTSASVNTRDWCEGQRFILQLPHETDNVAVECICTKIGINPYPPNLIDIEAVMLDSDVIPPDYYWQKVMYTQAQGANEDITASMTAQGGDNDVLSDM